jgi:plasminogen activator
MKRIVIMSALTMCAFLLPDKSYAFQADNLMGPAIESEKRWAFEVSIGQLNGDAVEHVYDYDGPGGSRRQLSRLDWDLNDIVMGGGRVTYKLGETWTLNGGIWLALTEGSGEMDNYDWLLVNSAEPTHYSLSEVDVTEGYIIDLNVAWDFLKRDNLIVRGLLGYKQNGWTWEDRGVFALYPEYGYIPIDLGGENYIDYEQEFRIPYIGASADGRFDQFSFSGYLAWSPLVAANDWDHHIAREIRFKESFEGGDMIGLGLSARYHFSPKIYGALSYSYQKIDLIIGDMEIDSYGTGETEFIEDAAGIENEYSIISISAGFTF